MLKSVHKRLPKFLQRITATLLWVKEYRKTVCPTGSYMLLIRKGKRSMSDESSWIYDIIPEAQAKAMNEKGEKIKDFMNNGVTVVLSASNQSAIEICQTWQKSLMGDPFAWVRIGSFMSGLIETIEQHLFEEGINPYEEEA